MENLFWRSGKELAAQELKGRRIDDEKLRELVVFLAGRFQRHRYDLHVVPTQLITLRELDLGDNCIGNNGVCELAAALVKNCVELRVLKLFKNRISAPGAQAVASFIERVAKPPAEVHLSHNCLGPADARRLFAAAARRKEYPLHGWLPLWLRLERQQDGSLWDGFEPEIGPRFERMTEMVEFAESRLLETRRELGLPLPRDSDHLVCQVLYRHWQEEHKRCKATSCCNARSNGTGPILHLPYIWDQGLQFREKGYAKGYGDKGSNAADMTRDELQMQFDRVVAASANWAASNRQAAEAAPSGLFKQEPTVLYESGSMMVLNKSAHWLCTWNAHKSCTYWTPDNKFKNERGKLHQDDRTWQEILVSGQREHLDNFLARRFEDEMARAWWSPGAGGGAGCVHRLDKETSGCMIRAKTQAAFDSLVSDLRRQKITKTYRCLVHGEVPPGKELEIKDCIGVDQANNEAFIDPGGEWAETRVRCMAHFYGHDHQRYSFCEVQIITGRTHQIRVHMMHKRHPLVSDPKYCPMLVLKDRRWCPRTFLHATAIAFDDGGEQCRIAAPLPDDLRHALSCLELKEDFSAGELQEVCSHPATTPASSCSPSSTRARDTRLPAGIQTNSLPRADGSSLDAAPEPVTCSSTPPSLSIQSGLPQETTSTSPEELEATMTWKLATTSGGPPTARRSQVDLDGHEGRSREDEAGRRKDEAGRMKEVAPDVAPAAEQLPSSFLSAAPVVGPETAEQAPAPLSPRAFQIVSECVRNFAGEHNVDVDGRLLYTAKKLQQKGLRSIADLAGSAEEEWPKDRKGELIIPARLMNIISQRAFSKVLYQV